MPMTVEELSRRTGVAANTIRYYTRIGLLRPGRHPSNGYRLFGEEDVRRLIFVGKAKRLGFSLSEIRRLIRTAQEGGSTCALARRIVASRAVQVRRQIAALKKLYGEMEAAQRAWQNMPDGAGGESSICPLIESVVPDHVVWRRAARLPSPIAAAE